MLIACNYSTELITLIQNQRVTIDYIKLALYDMFKEGFEISRTLRSVLLHGVLPNVPERTGMRLAQLAEIDWRALNAAVKAYGSPHIGLHLDMKRSDLDGEANTETIVAHMIEVAQTWAANLEVPFSIENVPYSHYYAAGGSLECISQPEVIREVCERANVGLLLDLSHAKVTAWHRGEDPREFLAQLPLERVKEIHVVGSQMTADGLRDRHVEMTNEDYALLEWTLAHTPAEIVTLEYGGPAPLYEGRSDLAALERQLVRLQHICTKQKYLHSHP